VSSIIKAAHNRLSLHAIEPIRFSRYNESEMLNIESLFTVRNILLKHFRISVLIFIKNNIKCRSNFCYLNIVVYIIK